jgi:maleate isomerase
LSSRITTTEYGSRGLVGIGVPQANPTVEQEVFALRPPGLSIVTARLTSSVADAEQRVLEYFERTLDYAAQFDDLGIDAFGIACTGSSYLLGKQREVELSEAFSAQLGYPVITAALAIEATLQKLQAKRISIVSPYPDWLAERSREFWSNAGYTVAEMRAVPLTGANIHSIYALRSGDALQQAYELDLDGVDAVLFTGTGMPTLGAINPLQQRSGLPVLSSNLCLLSALAQQTGASAEMLLPVPADLDTSTL